MNSLMIGLISILFTLLIYIAAIKLYKHYRYPFTFPLLVATIFIVSLFLIVGIQYETYYIGGQWIERLLGPAVVALAFPLYKQLHMLKSFFVPLIVGVLVGAVTGIISGIILADWLGYDEGIIYSMLPKSVTAPVAMDIAHTLGGIPSLTAVFVMFAGLGGAVLSPYCFRMFRLTNEVAKGVGIGTASHAIGTAKILETSEEAGAASSVAMIVSAVVVSIIGPLLVILLY
ncbi:LrgB family protein [Bacillus solitudinis]|uniref:LrgB family protein n=1 Tax=Bacillus solitudinis TaxID=2014074 RepID=UPI000C230959|nr:LrgB family protein [Bacillus solitudinis]